MRQGRSRGSMASGGLSRIAVGAGDPGHRPLRRCRAKPAWHSRRPAPGCGFQMDRDRSESERLLGLLDYFVQTTHSGHDIA